MGVLHQYVDWKEGTLATRYMAFIQLYVALVKNGLRHQNKCVEFKQQYFSENETGNFWGIFGYTSKLIYSMTIFTLQMNSIETGSLSVLQGSPQLFQASVVVVER